MVRPKIPVAVGLHKPDAQLVGDLEETFCLLNRSGSFVDRIVSFLTKGVEHADHFTGKIRFPSQYPQPFVLVVGLDGDGFFLRINDPRHLLPQRDAV